MIGFFLDPYSEEIMYSVIARNAAALNFPNLRSVGITYFGEAYSIATVALPCRLEYLVTHLPPGTVYTVDKLIDEHTLLPFFSPFLPQGRVTQLHNDMSGACGMGIHMRAGVMASSVPMPVILRLCPTCAEEDREQYGEWFWHSQHQAPGVHVCAKHQVWLEASSIQLANRQTRHEYITAERAGTYLPSSRLVSKTPLEDVLLAIAQSAQWLFEQKPTSQGLEYLRERYVRALAKCDLATFAGRVRISEVLEAFMAFYSEEILAFLHCDLDMQSQDNWLARLIRKPDSALHPLHHLLLMHFLGGSIADYLLGSLKPPQPFGNGPWPCLNPACNYYNMCIIKTCIITYPPGLNGQPSGTFSCTCGFIYGRSGPDVRKDAIYRRGKIINVGEVWESTLQQYWTDDSLSLREIAKRLGVDPLTVKRHVQRLGLSTARMKLNNEMGKMPNAEHSVQAVYLQRECMRATWQEACDAYGHCGRKAVRQQGPRVYTWLYRHDRDWLEQHLPPRKRLKPPQRIDWAARDIEISQLIPEAVNHLQTLPGPPHHITITAIGRSIGYLAMIQQHLDLLPLTTTALAEAEESRVAFAIRRIQWASTCFYTQGRVPKAWELARLSGVGRLLSDVVIQQILDEVIDELKQSLMLR